MAGPNHRRAGLAAGSKFDTDGAALPFAGNTIISPINPSSDVAEVLRNSVRELGDAVVGDFTLLPESSWHMTVFELLCDQVRTQAHWSNLMPTDASLDEIDRLFIDRVAAVERPAAFTMRPVRLNVTDGGIDIGVEPVDELTARSLSDYRNQAAAATGVRFPNHDTYRFHITLGYTILEPAADRRDALDAAIDRVDRSLVGTTFELDGPALTFFADMTEFSATHRPS